MYPEEPFNTNSQAETNMFYFLKKQLSEDFIILHSFAWLSSFLQKTGYTPEKEIDFLILHKIYGVLVLEVKGGDIKYKGYCYFSNNKKINHPDKQAASNMHAFRKLILDNLGLTYSVGFAVVFPDTFYDKNNTPPSLVIQNIKLIIDKNDICNLETKIIEIMLYWKKQFNKEHNSEKFKDIINFLVKMDNRKFSLKDKVEYDEKKWLYLSSEQDKYLKLLINNKLMYISGRAGTGKTILAIILSRYLKDKKILFLTYNKLISEQVKSEVNSNTDAMTFHKFLKINAPNSINFLDDSDSALEYIINNYKNMYDVLIVDEAQSLNIRWLIKLKKYFYDNNKEVFLFADTIQSLSGEEKNTDELIMKELSISDRYVLTKNYRAPEKVYNRLNEFFQPNIEHSSVREVTNKDLFEVFDDDPRGKLVKALDYLENDNVNMKDVAILVSSNLGGFDSIKLEFQGKYPELIVETINKFRGMEKPVIIILLAIENDFNELYVAYSRSTTQTIVIVDKPLIFSMPDFASLLLESNTTQNSIKQLISNHINNLRQEYFIEENKIKHYPSTFQLYFQENFWIIKCIKELTIESKILIMYLSIHNEIIIVFENQKLEKVKLFHPLCDNESDNLKFDNLKYSYCSGCKKIHI